MKTCSYCGEEVYREPGIGLVCARSGDDGGTYDFCPESPDEKHSLTKIPNDERMQA